MTWHPTTNRIPFGLLTNEEWAILEAWPHGREYFSAGAWHTCGKGVWGDGLVYRGKPAPVVTSVWFNLYPDRMRGPYRSREKADDVAGTSLVDVLRIDTCNGVSTAHLGGLK